MNGKTLRGFKDQLASSLRTRVLLLTLAAFVAVAIPAAISFVWIVDKITITLGTLVAERQILYDRYRGLESLRREVALAETLMRSPTIVEWAEDEFDRDLYARGIAELEHFRRTFADRSYFFVNDRSGNYYFNDHDGSFVGEQLRYTLSPGKEGDAWYYSTRAAGSGCHLNVNHDDILAVTKVWINCVVEENGRILGLVGTGIDLTVFVRDVVDTSQRGVESLFVDGDGAIQASPDPDMIDYRSLTKDDAEKSTFLHLLGDEGDRAAFRQMMREAALDEMNPPARMLEVEGRELLVGVGHLAELGWYNVTLMDLGQIVERRLFGPIAALIALIMISAVTLVTFLFKRNVLDRLAQAERAVHLIERGNFSLPPSDQRNDEIGRLARALNRMAGAVSADRNELEAAVRERTEQLERIAYVDPLSGVLNRRGFIEAYAQGERRRKKDVRPGLLILDIDHFKTINDTHGHIAGDRVIVEIARRLIEVTREQDLCARWGGDELVVILDGCDAASLALIGNKILDAVRTHPVDLGDGVKARITISIGAYLAGADETLESAASRADAALYAAKQRGRDRLVIYDPAVHGDGKVQAGRVA